MLFIVRGREKTGLLHDIEMTLLIFRQKLFESVTG
jgi:hypothetical protein